jgi:hypothetical protein
MGGLGQCRDTTRTVRRQTHLVKTKALATGIPREGREKGIQLFRGVSEAREVLAENNDHIGTGLLRVRNQLELVEALSVKLAG